MSITEIHTRLSELEAERMTASLAGLANDPAYMADLTEEIAAARHAYVGAAVTEIASLRAELSGPLEGWTPRFQGRVQGASPMSEGDGERTLAPMFTTTDIHQRLDELESERMLATLIGLSTDQAYMANLRTEIDATRDAYVGAAVTEIASLRAELSGPLYG